jgi:hypothetical protein
MQMKKYTIKSAAVLIALMLLLPCMTLNAGDKTKLSEKNTAGTTQQQDVEALPAALQPEQAVDNPVSSQSRADEQINWYVISGGSGTGSSTNYILDATVGQFAVGSGSSTNYILINGFWQDFGGAAPCDCTPGDANGNTVINILDITYLINYVYKGGPAPTPYALCSGDPTGNCTINILDITYLISYLYKGGPPPVACEQWLTNCGAPLRN